MADEGSVPAELQGFPETAPAASKAPQIQVANVMTKDVLAIDANDTLDVIAGLFEKYDYDGMPVVDASRKLLGIITAYDMILQSSDMHLPTVLKLMDQVVRDKSDRRAIDEHFGKLHDIKATAIMNAKPVTVKPETPLEEAAKIFADHHNINPLVVVDAQGNLAGVLSRYDVIKFFNETYLKQVVSATKPASDPFRKFPSKSESDVQQAVDTVEKDFMLVQKRRPLIWRYVAIGMFVAGLVAATALIIRIVQKTP